MSGPKYPSDFSRRNQAIIAERTRWPVGALKSCWELEDRFPGWHVSWLHENQIRGFERPAGYWAVRETGSHQADVFRTDLVELADVMESVPECGGRWCSWCMAHPGRRPKL